MLGVLRRAKLRSSPVICAIRSVSSTTWLRLTAALSGLPRPMNAAAFSEKVRIAATGWLISCATPAATCPSVARRLACASSSRERR